MADYEKLGLLHEIFTCQAQTTPDKVAVIEADGREVTFRQLDKDADILAVALRSRGVMPDSCVAIYMHKSIEFVVAYIAILKAGGAYLPLDIAYPESLLTSIVTDANPVVILNREDLHFSTEVPTNVITMTSDWQERLSAENAKISDIPQSPALNLDNLAYVVYSSGSTGKPKGIRCPHRGAVFSYNWRHQYYPYNDEDREACNIFFVWEMLRPLQKGIPMYIIPTSVIYDPPLLCDFIEKQRITRMLFTPSLLEALLNTPGLDLQIKFKSFRQVWFCGEVVTTSLLERCMKQLPWIRFINLYSVSECHDIACHDLSQYFNNNKDEVYARKFCPVGKVLSGAKIIILNDENKIQPVGASGEIYVGGPTLAWGYLNRPELQAKRFIQRPDGVPASVGDRLYKTGDWGYMLSNGCLEICGRCDSMVKIRGYSIEVQAVEAALLELSMIQACVVLVHGEEGEDKFLVAYIVPDEQTSKKEVRAALKRKLPFYMIPAYFVSLSSIPVVPATGKLDKAALPHYDMPSGENDNLEGQPTTETEKKVAEFWKQVLQMKDIDIQESFFDLGGHSLLATQLLTKVRSSFSIDIAVKDFFTYPTVASLSKLIDDRQQNVSDVQRTGRNKLAIDLLAEVDKHDQDIVNIDMQLRAFWRVISYNNERRFQKGRVMLTGVTGFLGAFLLKELITQTKTHIYCLVRDLPDTRAEDRIKQNLSQYGILSSDGKPTEEQIQVEQALKKRITTIKGNVALMNLGMNEEDYIYLSTDIDFIIHAAASVNLVYPYSALHGANVLGTENVLVFACTAKIKPIHYISTDAVFPHGMTGCSEEDTLLEYHTKLSGGYAQSKWVAEQLINRAIQRGIPATVYRLGNLSGDSEHAYWNPQDFTLLMLQACAKIGMAPDVDWKMEITPVNFAAEVIIKLTQNLMLSVSKTIHIINTKPLYSRWVFEWMNAHGYQVEIVNFDTWREKILEDVEKTESDGHTNGQLQQLVKSYAKDPSFFTNLSTYTNDNLLHILGTLGLSYPYTDSSLLQTYFRQLAKRGVIKRARRSRTMSEARTLDGRVAIVTGSSSGIGKAIAIALAKAGAKVAMAARRLTQLEEIQKQIAHDGGIAVSVKTDVTKRDEVKELIKHTETTLGPVDILVNSAGVMYYTMMKNLHEEEWERQIDINCKGVTNCIGGVLNGMLKCGKGHIINISSDAGRKGFPGLAVYSGTKFFVEGLSQALRQEVCDSGVRVTCIQPGDVRTELFAHTTDEEAKSAFDGSSKCKILEPEDVANAVVYAVTQPEYVGINEILIEPRQAPV